MIIRILGLLASLAVIATATHWNVMLAGGYSTPAAPMIIAVAVLLFIGTSVATKSWRDGSKGLAIVFSLCLGAGEIYWLAINAQHEFSDRKAALQPIEAAKLEAARLGKRLATATQKEAEAQHRKDTADAEAIRQAPLPGCRKECRALLEGAKRTAQGDLDAARDERSAGQQALDALPPVDDGEQLATALGISETMWDFALSCLRAVMVCGGSIGAAISLHPKRPKELTLARSEYNELEQKTPVEELGHTRRIEPRFTIIDEASAVPPEAWELQSPLLPPKPAPKQTGQSHVAEFLSSALQPDPKGTASLRSLYTVYLTWCSLHKREPLPVTELGQHLKSLIELIGLDYEPQGSDVVVKGAKVVA